MAPHDKSGSDDAPTLASPSGSSPGPDATADLTTGSAFPAGSHPIESPAQLRPGDLFAGRYRIASFLGRGGFSFVFRAQDLTNGETVALKFLAAREGGQDLVDRMRRELRLARDLRHPNIVRVHELHEFGGFYGLSMEFVEGLSLKEVVLERKTLPLDEAIGYWKSLASALAAVHAAGIVHRDLKPHNVMVSPAGEVKLLDFGLARTPDSTGLTATGTILGTPDYMSPEQVEGKEADARSDVYSLGITAWELLVGEPPYRGDSSLAVAFQHVRSRVPDPRSRRPDVPERVARLVLRMTEPVPAKRPASAQDLLVDLASLSAKGGTARRGSPLPVAVGAAALLLAAGGGFWWWRGRTAASGGDPMTDGVVHLALATARPGEILGGGPFLSAVRDALAGRAGGAPVRLHPLSADEAAAAVEGPTDLAGDGVEQLLVITLSGGKDDAGAVFHVDADVLDTRSGRPWRRVEGAQVRSLDFESVDLAAQKLAAAYRALLTSPAAPAPPVPPPSPPTD